MHDELQSNHVKVMSQCSYKFEFLASDMIWGYDPMHAYIHKYNIIIAKGYVHVHVCA